MTTTPAIAKTRFTVVQRADSWAIFDTYKYQIAVGGPRAQKLINMSLFGAQKWANIFNIVDKGGCGMCGQLISSLPRESHQLHWDAHYKWICNDCFFNKK